MRGWEGWVRAHGWRAAAFPRRPTSHACSAPRRPFPPACLPTSCYVTAWRQPRRSVPICWAFSGSWRLSWRQALRRIGQRASHVASAGCHGCLLSGWLVCTSGATLRLAPACICREAAERQVAAAAAQATELQRRLSDAERQREELAAQLRQRAAADEVQREAQRELQASGQGRAERARKSGVGRLPAGGV